MTLSRSTQRNESQSHSIGGNSTGSLSKSTQRLAPTQRLSEVIIASAWRCNIFVNQCRRVDFSMTDRASLPSMEPSVILQCSGLEQISC